MTACSSEDRPLKSLDSEQLLQEGKNAHRRGDEQGLRECLRELAFRRSNRAQDVEEELRALPSLAASVKPSSAPALGDSLGPGFDSRPRLLFDRDIHFFRDRLIREALRSIWLSSWTFPNAGLVELLARRAGEGLEVTLVVAVKFAAKNEDQIAILDHAGVQCRWPKSTHSKLLIVDDQSLLIGSANASWIHRDACAFIRDPLWARESIVYLSDLCSRDEDQEDEEEDDQDED